MSFVFYRKSATFGRACSDLLSLARPFKVILTCTHLKMTLGYTQVHLCIADKRERSFCFYPVHSVTVRADVFKAELLLINRCRGQESRFDSPEEPLGSCFTGIAHILDAFSLHIPSWIITIAKGNHTAKFLIICLLVCLFDIVVSEPYPTSVKPKGLSEKNQLFTIVANSL